MSVATLMGMAMDFRQVHASMKAKPKESKAGRPNGSKDRAVRCRRSYKAWEEPKPCCIELGKAGSIFGEVVGELDVDDEPCLMVQLHYTAEHVSFPVDAVDMINLDEDPA